MDYHIRDRTFGIICVVLFPLAIIVAYNMALTGLSGLFLAVGIFLAYIITFVSMIDEFLLGKRAKE